MLVTAVNGYLKAFWYNDGYVRTCGKKFDLTDITDRMIHFTNDAV